MSWRVDDEVLEQVYLWHGRRRRSDRPVAASEERTRGLTVHAIGIIIAYPCGCRAAWMPPAVTDVRSVQETRV